MVKELGPLRDVPYMGVIYVVAEASKLGYYGEHPDWCNLGQGMPEVGPLPGAPERVTKISISPDDHAYGPVAGLAELREAVAALYNLQFRRGKRSQYTARNVAITAGGRLALTRAVWALGEIRMGYFTPDYTAYEDLLGGIPRVTPIHLPLPLEEGFAIPASRLEADVLRHGLNALLVSNPCNPTGRVIRDGELESWVSIARKHRVALLLDEFYSHFVWNGSAPVSAAAYIEDVDRDPLILIDGLTKNYRYPGWRVGWTLGPPDWIETLTCSGSAIDGGGPRWLQRVTVPLVEPEHARQETQAMRDAFRPKRDFMLEHLKGMGVLFPRDPEGTFYCWGCVGKLPPPLNDGFQFFREALKEQVITVPGEFFDVNPGKQRSDPPRLKPFVRFSFGAPMTVVQRGIGRLESMVRRGSGSTQ
ncbi:MAG: pyridoxal phosphate-dependent aminotransferase [Acidobacteriota bacterium]|jgi:aspartate/methionine/tyrosine aminotransferase